MNQTKTLEQSGISTQSVLADYQLAHESRQTSILGRKEVFMGKAKFGIFGDGKEVPQIAMAKAFRKGDFRSGYYRDQTFMFAIGQLSIQQFFAQLYAHTSVSAEPSSGGRLMNSHFSTRLLDDQGRWIDLTENFNSSSDISPTAAQIPRLVGLGHASKIYRENPDLKGYTNFSKGGKEIAFGTIGNAATAEGIFLEAVNAIGVLQIPVILSVWDDDYGISVPNEYQITKSDISKALSGFQREDFTNGLEIIKVKGWDYQELLNIYQRAADLARKDHIPSLIHVVELTQPQGHSTSGSHERYKSKERLAWEEEFDCLKKLREWILENEISYADRLDQIEEEAVKTARKAKDAAWKAYFQANKKPLLQVSELLKKASEISVHKEDLSTLEHELAQKNNPLKQDAIKALKRSLRLLRKENLPIKAELQSLLKDFQAEFNEKYSDFLFSKSEESAFKVPVVKPEYSEHPEILDGREILQACFSAALERDPRIVAFGEDLGKIGDVNQGFAGLQEQFGELRVFDTGIRETSIIGQGIGMALRGLRPIAEVQYLDYLIFTLQTLTDDLATLQYRTKGGQKAPLIIRTRGHRLEGVWHSGSPMGMILHSLRGIHVLVPRNMTQAAGLYNTILQSDDPALMIECLNGYRMKEPKPENIGTFTVGIGNPEVIRQGTDITIVTYGAMCKIIMEATKQLEQYGISCEVVDVQTLLPFDINHTILESVKKTNRVIFADEDVPGGASAFMMQKVLDEQNAYPYLDSKPVCISAKDHRPAYGSDGDYFSKPNTEDVFDAVYAMMSEFYPRKFPPLY